MAKAFIIINLQFPAVHFWKECDIEEVSYLKYPHRHMFHVSLTIPVKHNERDIEFIVHKRKIELYCKEFLVTQIKEAGWSCESIAQHLLERYQAQEVTVLEDGENGAKVINEK